MRPVRRQTIAEQTAEHLREGFRSGRWSGHLPGVARLAREIAVSRDSVRAALRLLQKAGALKDCGAGKRRQIVTPRKRQTERRILRVAILLNCPLADDNSHSQQLFLLIRHAVESAGHVCFFAERSIVELRGQRTRIANFAKTVKADAWIIYSATSDVLAWFAAQKIPAFAVGGRTQGIPIGGTRTDLSTAIASAVDALVAHGHRRIVMICPLFWARPTLGPNAAAFFCRLAHHRIPAGDYNLPEWDETADGLVKLLGALFSVTPPTALLISEPVFCAAALAFLGQRKILIPRDLSLVCMLSDPVFSMRRPIIAHFEWPMNEHVRRVARWVEAIAHGREDLALQECAARFVPGGTIGPVKK